MSTIKLLEFYTEIKEPLMTNEGIRFFLKYQNVSSESIKHTDVEIIMGTVIRPVSIPGLDSQEIKTVEMILTNNISDELKEVGVRLIGNPNDSIINKYQWIGQSNVQIGELERHEEMDTETERYYQVIIHNKGTRRAQDTQIVIEKDNEYYGDILIPELAPKISTPVNLALLSKKEGLFKLGITARKLKQNKMLASRSFHIQI